jgi:fatty-acyl-CoA synthase
MIIAETGRSVSYRELDERSSQLAWLLDRRAVGRDATVAVIAENVAEWAEVIWGANRSGRYVAPVNWHVSPQEMAELLIACQATVVVTTSAQLPSVQAALTSVPGIALALVVGDGGSALPPGLEWYEAALAGQPTTPVAGEQLGGRVMFSSGTTGQPKVIRHPGPGVHPCRPRPTWAGTPGCSGWTAAPSTCRPHRRTTPRRTASWSRCFSWAAPWSACSGSTRRTRWPPSAATQ